MRGVPVTSVEYTDGFIIIGCREATVEANEADFVVDLCSVFELVDAVLVGLGYIQ